MQEKTIMKIWQIKNRPKTLILSDEELIIAIKKGLLKGEDVLINTDLEEEVAIKDTVYEIYLRKQD